MCTKIHFLLIRSRRYLKNHLSTCYLTWVRWIISAYKFRNWRKLLYIYSAYLQILQTIIAIITESKVIKSFSTTNQFCKFLIEWWQNNAEEHRETSLPSKINSLKDRIMLIIILVSWFKWSKKNWIICVSEHKKGYRSFEWYPLTYIKRFIVLWAD